MYCILTAVMALAIGFAVGRISRRHDYRRGQADMLTRYAALTEANEWEKQQRDDQ